MLSRHIKFLFSIVQAHPSLQILIIGFLAIGIYCNSIHGNFILDDWTYIVENPFIRDFSFVKHIGNLKQYLAAQGILLPKDDVIYNVTLRPASYLTFALNYRFHGLDTVSYKIVNILFHVTASTLVFIFVHLLVQQLRFLNDETDNNAANVPFLVSLLFACHPIQTQAVSYIIQRFTSIAACCYILTLTAYIKSRRSTSPAVAALWYGIAFASTITGMLTKENVFTLPVMIAVVELLCFRETLRKRFFLLVPFLATMAIIPLTVMSLSGQNGNLHASTQLVNFDNIPHSAYIFTEFRVVMTYLRLLLLPVGQQLDYDYPLYTSLFDLPVLVSLLCILLLLIGSALALYKGYSLKRSWLSLAGFGIVWFFVTLSVESGLVPTEDVIFEHRLYLPSIGIFIAITAAGCHFFSLYANKSRWRIGVVTAVTAVIVMLAIATVRRNELWADTLKFWQDNAAKSPAKPRVQQCLGDTYLLNGMPREAIAAYEKIPLTQTTPKLAKVYMNLADAYIKVGNFYHGVKMYLLAIQCDPFNHLPYSNLGFHYAMRGEYDTALELLAAAIKLNRHDLLSRRARADIFTQQAKFASAITEYEDIIKIYPRDTYALLALQRLQR